MILPDWVWMLFAALVIAGAAIFAVIVLGRDEHRDDL